MTDWKWVYSAKAEGSEWRGRARKISTEHVIRDESVRPLTLALSLSTTSIIIRLLLRTHCFGNKYANFDVFFGWLNGIEAQRMRDNNGWQKKHAATRLDYSQRICSNFTMCTGAMRKEHSDAVHTSSHQPIFITYLKSNFTDLIFACVGVCACVLLTFDLYEWRNYLQCQWHGWVEGVEVGGWAEVKSASNGTIQWLAINIQCDMLWSFFSTRSHHLRHLGYQ